MRFNAVMVVNGRYWPTPVMTDTKSLLKEARKAIDSLEYDVAVRKCREVLNKDENNYMGLVLLGVGLRNDEAAVSAFEKAISVNGTAALAYRGLAKLYESEIAFTERLPELYHGMSKLAAFDREEMHRDMYCAALRIADSDTAALAEIFLRLYGSESDPEEKKTLLRIAIRVLTDTRTTSWSSRSLPLVDIALKGGTSTFRPETSFLIRYLTCIEEAYGLDRAVDRFSELDDDSVEIKEWICEALVRRFVSDLDKTADYRKYDAIVEKVDSASGRRAAIVLELLKNNPSRARAISDVMLKNAKRDFHTSILGAFSCIESGRYVEAEHVLKGFIDNASARRLLLRAKCMRDDDEEVARGIELENELDAVSLRDEDHVALFHAYLRLKRFPDAERHLKNLPESSTSRRLLEAALSKAVGKLNEALEILTADRENHLCQLQMAIIYLETKDYEKAFSPLLHAAKCDPDNYIIYLHLGHFYALHAKNYEKAKKCYLKAFELNPDCSKAGKHLSKMYTKLEEWDCNETFLSSLVNDGVMTADNESSWPWLYLGLHYTTLEKWDTAVVNLRTYIRLNPLEVDAWETLADAYHHRGSYTSAMKCYKKTIELDPTRNNCHVQIGTIQCMLGFFNDALESYRNIHDGNFSPAINGLARVEIKIADDMFSKNLYGLSRDKIQKAVDSISSLLPTNNKIVCLWKTVYDAILVIMKLPHNYCWLHFDDNLLQNTDKRLSKLYKNKDVYNLALSCLEKIIQLTNKNVSSVHYEMANIYQAYYEYTDDPIYAEKAYTTLEKCLKIEKDKWQTWNLLGVVCISKPIVKYNLAQHAFMKALELDPINTIVWSNLGVLYLILGNNNLANRSFAKAQESDPAFIQCWIGQAIIAETVNHHDTIDIFRHASQLGFHKESSLGYSYYVARNLINASDNIYSIKNMNALTMAHDLILRYNEYDIKNPCSWNICGILLEKMGYLNGALNAYNNAILYSNPEIRDVVLLNSARVCEQMKNYEKSMKILQSISNVTLDMALMLALFYYKNDHLEESYDTYAEILEWKGDDDNIRNNVLIAMANICYRLGKYKSAIILLFQSITINEEENHVEKTKSNIYVQALLNCVAISLLKDKLELADIALRSLPIVTDKKMSLYANTMKSYYLLICNGYTATIRELSNEIHTTPDNYSLWEIMAKLSFQDVTLANKSSKKCMLLNDIDNKWHYLQMACLSELIMGNFEESKRYAQKMVRAKPYDAKNWALLISTILSGDKTINRTWLRKLLDCIIHKFDLPHPLQMWLINLYQFLQ